MKLPKNRANVYVVYRMGTHPAVCGVFTDYEDADNYAGACKQQWLERYGVSAEFNVQLSTFYG